MASEKKSWRVRSGWRNRPVLQVTESQMRFVDQMTSVDIQERTVWRDATLEEAIRFFASLEADDA